MSRLIENAARRSWFAISLSSFVAIAAYAYAYEVNPIDPWVYSSRS